MLFVVNCYVGRCGDCGSEFVIGSYFVGGSVNLFVFVCYIVIYIVIIGKCCCD